MPISHACQPYGFRLCEINLKNNKIFIRATQDSLGFVLVWKVVEKKKWKELVFLCCLIISLVTLLFCYFIFIPQTVCFCILFPFFSFIFKRYLILSFRLLVYFDKWGFWVQTKKYIDLVFLVDDIKNKCNYILLLWWLFESYNNFNSFMNIGIFFYIVCEWGLQSHISQLYILNSIVLRESCLDVLMTSDNDDGDISCNYLVTN